jgi:organic radical activating enzyme
MRRLRFPEVLETRFTPGRAALLYLTDRCPVGCAHCSVDARADSPSISDFALFAELVAALAADERLTMVGISGGEPFVERRGLLHATAELAEAGKDVVLYTSGVWARHDGAPAWVGTAIDRACCVVLSTDAYHADSVDDDRWVRAATTVASYGVPLAVQVLDLPEMVEAAQRLLERAFGAQVADHADLSLIAPLPYGRGEGFFQLPPAAPPSTMGRCALLAAPVVRYDGVVTACCNEQVIKGRGPERLRRSCGSGSDLTETLGRLRSDGVLRVLGGKFGARGLVEHPEYADLASGRFRGICDLCWRAQLRARELGDEGGALLGVLASIGEEEVLHAGAGGR